jgi:hypothetical protein
MKLKLVGNDYADVVTAYYVCAPFAFVVRHCSDPRADDDPHH